MASTHLSSNYNRLIALWILRAFAPGLGRHLFFDDRRYADSDIAEFLGLPPETGGWTPPEVSGLMDQMLSALENSAKACLPAMASRNFTRFATTLSLNPVEQRIIEFFACMECEPALADMARVLREVIPRNLQRFLSRVLNLPRRAVAAALARGGKLIKCGLLVSTERPRKECRFEFHSDKLAFCLLRESYDSNRILKSFGVVRPPAPDLGLTDFPHLQEDLDLLLPYLKSVAKKGKPGVNVLLHGAPGTGKSQLARVIGRELGLPVFETDTADDDGDPIRADKRLSVLKLAQSYFNDSPALLVFDEAEDILMPSPVTRGVAVSHKGWFNQMLEKNRRPVFWISNSIDTIDPAFSRRFDLVVEVPVPPKAQRDRILRQATGKLVSPELIARLANLEHLAPAVVTRARDVVQEIRKDIPKGACDAALVHVIGGVLKAQGHPDPAAPMIKVVQPGLYDIGHLNTSADLPQIANNLARNPSARMCLYGPPGTGKTSFAHWLAQQLDQPLLLRKASDLLSPYVGMTERLIARTFDTAKRDGAVLLIDEVDSFLSDRRQARQQWEVTQINEMLTQIESFPGILIASTNLIDHLDPASMRRFDIKLRFGYLLPEQVRRLLASYCRSLGLPQPSDTDLQLAATMDNSAPGDFAAVARQHRFQPFRDATGFLQAVIAESEHTAGNQRRIGFQSI